MHQLHRNLILLVTATVTVITIIVLKAFSTSNLNNVVISVGSDDRSNRLHRNVPSVIEDHVGTTGDESFKPVKRILLWTPLFSGMDYFPRNPDEFSMRNCHETRCDVTMDRKMLEESHAVVFHIRTFSMFDVPTSRNLDQKWIFFTLESPPYSSFPGFKFMYNMFNWTVTYRMDSDVKVPYGEVLMNNTALNPSKNFTDIWSKKSKLAVWLVSHCETHSQREQYVKELQKYVDVDVLGTCGKATCPQNKTKECMESFSRDYMFFLAFENAICKDYVTEKFFRALEYDIVPVVFGGADYKTIAPPNSYIDAQEFTSPKSLAKYLKTVALDSAKYVSYLQWKTTKHVVKDEPNFCDLCGKLHSKHFRTTSVYKNMADWWIRKSNCIKFTI